MNTLTFRLSFIGKQFFQPNYKVYSSNGIIYNTHGTVVSQKYRSNKIKEASGTTTPSKQTNPSSGQKEEGPLQQTKSALMLQIHF